MKFYFPDSQDLVDPSFDFETELRHDDRVRHRDDLYAHEVFEPSPYDGLLVSRAMVEGVGAGSRYSFAQRQRLEREGGNRFFRLRPGMTLMADCGAFSYVNEPEPPFSVGEVLSFYESLDCDYGLSVDHVILAYRPEWDSGLFGIGGGAPEDVRARQQLTIRLARDFFDLRRERGTRFEPMGVAQGWSPTSYRQSADALLEIGYRYIALGGLVPLKTPEILAILREVRPVLRHGARIHLLGVTRLDSIALFSEYGVASFDSTSPLRQAFKDSKDNYYTMTRTYMAVRVPQVDGNPRLQREIQAGRISQDRARELERGCLKALKEYDRGRGGVAEPLKWLEEYEFLVDPRRAHLEGYREVLEAMPWKACACEVCRELGHHVILFRGAERNRRRGFHNVWITRRRLDAALMRETAEVQLEKGR